MNQIFLNKETVLSSTSIRHLPLESMSFSGGKNKIIITGKNFEYILSILKERVIYNAKNKAKNALKRAGSRDTPKIILEILMDHDYRKSPKHFIPKPEFISKIKRQISDDKPVELVIPLFPCKVHNRLKAKGIYPDLSEILTILRLMEICLAIKEVYNPGGHFLIAADGFRFKKSWRVSSEDIKNYQDRIKEFINLTGANKYMELVDYEKFINENYSKEEKLQRNFNYLKAVSKYRSFSQKIRKSNFKNSFDLFNYAKIYDPDFDYSNSEGRFVPLFRSTMYSICFSELFRDLSDSDIKYLFQDIYDTKDKNYGKIREKILEITFKSTINYMTAIRTDRSNDPLVRILPYALRCTIHSKPGQIGLSTISKSARIESWHGTGFIDKKGKAGVDFLISLETEGYLPVFIYGNSFHMFDQPLFYSSIEGIEAIRSEEHTSELQSHVNL